MARRRILWQLYPSYLVITIVAILTVSWLASNSFRKLYLNQTISDLSARSAFVQPLAEDRISPPDTSYLQALCRELGHQTNTQMAFADLRGRILADSRNAVKSSENLLGLSDFGEALQGRIGTSVRLDLSDNASHLFVSAPIKRGTEIVGIVRMSYPIAAIDEALSSLRITVVVSVVMTALLAALVTLLVARRIGRPLEEVKRGAERFAAGELDYKLPVPEYEEIGGLASAMNRMAEQLHERIRTVVAQRNEQEAILAGMTEGILVVDPNDRLVIVNQVAADLFEIDIAAARGQLLQQAVRIPVLHKFVGDILTLRRALSGEVILYRGTETFLQTHGNVLRGERGEITGVLVVLHDVTQLRKLEGMRRDFVANVSHELKTPITSIKGYVETLLDAPAGPEDTRRFLDVIMRQADRLNAIIDDLLSLSRIEQGAERAEIALEDGNIEAVIRNSVVGIEKLAQAKHIHVALSCGADILAHINAPLLEQAIVNLIDNAIKYSPEGSKVAVSSRQTATETTISVTDTGPGIAKEHLPRIFERFFRVDKSRSREAGGTGLGLAIVKHIVLAHGGTISVKSELGAGSTFTIHLPRLAQSGRNASQVPA